MHFLSILAEHILNIIYRLSMIMAENDKDLIIRLIRRKFPHFFTSNEEHPVCKMIFAIILSESVVFTWTYIDILIMTISLALTTHFKLYNVELERAKHQVTDSFAFFLLKKD